MHVQIALCAVAAEDAVEADDKDLSILQPGYAADADVQRDAVLAADRRLSVCRGDLRHVPVCSVDTSKSKGSHNAFHAQMTKVILLLKMLS